MTSNRNAIVTAFFVLLWGACLARSFLPGTGRGLESAGIPRSDGPEGGLQGQEAEDEERFDDMKWCDTRQALRVLKDYVYRGAGPESNFTELFPHLADDVVLVSTDVTRLVGKEMVIAALLAYKDNPHYTTLSLDREHTLFSTLYNPKQGICGAMAVVNRTLVHPTEFPDAPGSVVELLPIFHYYRLKRDRTQVEERLAEIAGGDDGHHHPWRRRKMELSLIVEYPNAASLDAFFSFTHDNASVVCNRIGQFCDPLGVNPYGTLPSCIESLEALPQYVQAPCGIEGKVNILGDSRGCRAWWSMAGYTYQARGETDALIGICASIGPGGPLCNDGQMPLMEPQCDTPQPGR